MFLMLGLWSKISKVYNKRKHFGKQMKKIRWSKNAGTSEHKWCMHVRSGVVSIGSGARISLFLKMWHCIVIQRVLYRFGSSLYLTLDACGNCRWKMYSKWKDKCNSCHLCESFLHSNTRHNEQLTIVAEMSDIELCLEHRPTAQRRQKGHTCKHYVQFPKWAV